MKEKLCLFTISALCVIQIVVSINGCSSLNSQSESDDYYEGYYDGYEVGYEEGYSEGHSEGYGEGYWGGEDHFVYIGYDQGYPDGWREGFTSAIELSNDETATALTLALSVTPPIDPDYLVNIEANTLPNASCTVTVYYILGSSIDVGSNEKKADDTGYVSWELDVSIDTNPKHWLIVVTARVGGNQVSKVTDFIPN
jgi:hypothetical protein